MWTSKWHSLHNSVLDRKCLHFMWLRYNSKKHLFSCFLFVDFFVCLCVIFCFAFVLWFVCFFVCLGFFFIFCRICYILGGSTTLTIWKKSSWWHFFLCSIRRNLRCNLLENLFRKSSDEWLCYRIPLFGRSKIRPWVSKFRGSFSRIF